jgi:hypothetical protein
MCNAVCRLKINEVIYRIAWVNFGLCIDFYSKNFPKFTQTKFFGKTGGAEAICRGNPLFFHLFPREAYPKGYSPKRGVGLTLALLREKTIKLYGG